jgi:hypothetical protein
MAAGFFAADGKVLRLIRRQGVTGNIQVPLPAYSAVRRITFVNNTTNAVTGGIRVGNVTTGTQYVTAQAVAGTVNLPVETNTTTTGLALTASTLFIEAVTSWNSANIDLVVEYEEVNPLNKVSSAG